MEQENSHTGKGRRRALWAAVAIIAVAAAGVIGGKTFYEHMVEARLALAESFRREFKLTGENEDMWTQPSRSAF